MELTARQRAVLALVATGLCNKEVGRELGICEQSVKNHIRNIGQRLGIGWGEPTRTLAACWYAEQQRAHIEQLQAYLDGGCLVFANRESALAALGGER